MARISRRQIIDESTVGIYHCFSRCVRRAFLMGEDRLTGKSYDYRLDWIDEEARRLAGIFAVDVLGYGWMANHFHNIIRNRPDLVRQMSDREVARRWLELTDGRAKQPVGRSHRRLNQRLRAFVRNKKEMQEIRSRLSSISWFQRMLKQTIAKRANAEEGVTGKFWDGRFESVPIHTESELLAAMIYVDLNPIRAGLADTPETSRYTSAYARILSESQRRSSAATASSEQLAVAHEAGSTATQCEESDIAVHRTFDDWLSPIPLSESTEAPPIVTSAGAEPIVVSVRSSAVSPSPSKTPVDMSDLLVPLPARASNQGCLDMSLDQYLEMLDWSGRQFRSDKHHAIPSHLPSILERLGFSQIESWVETLQGYAARIARFFRAPVNTVAELASWSVGECPTGLSAAVM